MRLRRRICLALIVVTAAVFAEVRDGGFLTYDDDRYATRNPVVQQGLTQEGVRWAFTTTLASNWHPVTWLSHMLDWNLFGANPSGHHLMNLGLHVTNAVLLFLR